MCIELIIVLEVEIIIKSKIRKIIKAILNIVPGIGKLNGVIYKKRLVLIDPFDLGHLCVTCIIGALGPYAPFGAGVPFDTWVFQGWRLSPTG